jgi:transcriptional regulator with XRE-family HTH domain
MLCEDRPHIGAAIRRARLAAGMTQEHLAALIGVTQSHTSRLEFSPNPRDATIAVVAAAGSGRLSRTSPILPLRRRIATSGWCPN